MLNLDHANRTLDINMPNFTNNKLKQYEHKNLPKNKILRTLQLINIYGAKNLRP